jgi:hypothetical protein
MFVRQNQQQFRNSNADVQIFRGAGNYSSSVTDYAWSKPTGVQNIYMLLIGAGGENNYGAGNEGGGSGAVTVWYGAARNVPDNLVLKIATRQSVTTQVIYRGKTDRVLLAANGGVNNKGGTDSSANQFNNSGFYQSVAGQAGSASSVTASSTTFLCGGGYASGGSANYGYTTNSDNWNYFALQPIIVGTVAFSVSDSGKVAATGCGGAGSNTGTNYGGPGMILIASW